MANYLDYFYLVIVELDIEGVAHILILEMVMRVCVCMHAPGQLFRDVCVCVCVRTCIYPTLDKIMAWFLIFQFSTVSNVRAWLILWSLTS